ncbi:MAG TPA: 6,7-dimethyl-8-ribityllumazine synthase, partial [Pyrinomonadaceae bacterium]|nr:6,7-dimethyl-8-ribityllumazine synthase [Pyrinomonadaceae bacterium]
MPGKESAKHTFEAKGFHFAIVASRWNDSLVSRLIEGAVEGLKEASASQDAIEIFRVPGAFEISLAALKAAQSDRF